MSIHKLVISITFLAIFVMAARVTMDSDSWWHLRAGQWIVENRQVPQSDPFSYTRAGQSWQYPGWLVEVPMYGLYRAFGPGGLNVWAAAMITLAFAFVWPLLTGNAFLRAFVLVLAAASMLVYGAARPYLVTFVLAAFFLWVLEDHRWGRCNRLWLLPLAMVVWANSHGGFVVGFILWGVYFVGRWEQFDWRRMRWPQVGEAIRGSATLAAVGAAMALAVCLNPSGAVMLLYAFKTVSIGALRDHIQEWQSPNFHYLNLQLFAWLLLATLGAVGFSRRRLALTDFLSTAGFALMGLTAVRNIPFFALVAPVVLTRHADPFLRALARSLGLRLSLAAQQVTPRPQRILNTVLLGVLILAAALKVATVLPAEANWREFGKSLPVAAVEYLKSSQPPGRLFSSYNWGAYLLWALPEYPVFVDGRTDLYNDEIIGQWVTVVEARQGWQSLLDLWQVRTILLEPDRPLIAQLTAEGWHLLYEDDVAVVYGR